MSNLKEEIRLEWESFKYRNLTFEISEEDNENIIDFISSRLDEIEREVMELLPEEKEIKYGHAGQSYAILNSQRRGYNSAIQTIREKLINYFK